MKIHSRHLYASLIWHIRPFGYKSPAQWAYIWQKAIFKHALGVMGVFYMHLYEKDFGGKSFVCSYGNLISGGKQDKFF